MEIAGTTKHSLSGPLLGQGEIQPLIWKGCKEMELSN